MASPSTVSPSRVAATDGNDKTRRGRSLPVLTLLLSSVLSSLLASGTLLAQSTEDLQTLSGALEALSERVRPAVVQIVASGYEAGQGIVPSHGALLSRQQGSGSGVILDSSGYVVTNAHVVANASRIRVEVPLTDVDTDGRRSVLHPRGHMVRAQIVGMDLESDLAVLRLQVDRPDEHLIPKLGILALNLTPEVSAMLPALRVPRGVVVAVTSAGAFPTAGETLLPGDVIHAVNSGPVGSLVGLRTHLEPLGSGDAVVLQVERAGRLLYVSHTLD